MNISGDEQIEKRKKERIYQLYKIVKNILKVFKNVLSFLINHAEELENDIP